MQTCPACPASTSFSRWVADMLTGIWRMQVWSWEQQKSIADIDVHANVCTVQWNPISSYELAVGSANHDVHLYDLRRPNEPSFVFKGALPSASVRHVRPLHAGLILWHRPCRYVACSCNPHPLPPPPPPQELLCKLELARALCLSCNSLSCICE